MQIQGMCCLGAAMALVQLGCDPGESEADEQGAVRASAEAQVLLSGAVSRQIVADNQAMDAVWNLLARVEVQPNEVLEFYEPRPGMIVVSGAGAPAGGAKFRDPGGRDTAALWAAATDNVPLPEALHAALERSRQPLDMRASRAEEEQESGSFEPTLVIMDAKAGPQSGLRSLGGWCDTEYYSSGAGACFQRDFTVCWDDVTGYGAAWSHDAYYMYTNVCAADGDVIYRVSADEGWVPQGSWTVREDHWRWVETTDHPCDDFPFFDDCPYIEATVFGDFARYHYRFEVDEF